jgi:plasmid stabilization system protein ParE
MRKYEAIMERSLSYIARHPLAGELRPDVGPDVRIHRIEPYLAFYRIENGVVVIARILHQRRDTTGEII